MKFKNILFFILLISLYIGCSKNSSQNNTPSWYINPPNNTKLFIYGIGEGNTQEEAINNALNSMASRLTVSVASNINRTTNIKVNNNKNLFEKNIKSKLQIDVQQIKFNNIDTEQSIQNNSLFYILIKTDRKAQFLQKKREFLLLDKSIDIKYNEIKDYSNIEQIYILQKLISTINSTKNQAIVLNSLDNNFEISNYIEKYNSYINHIDKLKNIITILVKTDNTKNYFKDKIIDLLNQQQYRVIDNTDADMTIQIKNNIKYNTVRGWNIAKVTSTISIIVNNKVISNKQINTIGRSSISKDDALDIASKSFFKKIKKQTLDTLVFNK